MGQGQGPPEQPEPRNSPQGEHGEDCEDGRSAPLTLTQPDPAQRLGDDHPSGAKRAPEGAAPLPAGEAEGARGGNPSPLHRTSGHQARPKSREAGKRF